MSSPIGGPALKKDRLGVPSVVFFVMSAAAPLTVVAGVVTTGYAIIGVHGMPVASSPSPSFSRSSASATSPCLGTSPTPARSTPTSANGLGRPLGVGAAWMALLAYNALQVGLYGIIGAAAAGTLEQFFGITTEWWVIALVAWASSPSSACCGLTSTARCSPFCSAPRSLSC